MGSVWQSSGWSAWSTYKADAHRKYMNDAAVACGYSESEVAAESQTLESSLQVGISMQQIANYWISAHSKDNCQTATAVAMAESGGNCGATHQNSDSHSSIDRGLWQINGYWHPECSTSCALDCACNAKCAVSVWQSSGWSAWSTYKNDLHRKYMNDAAIACGYSSSEIQAEQHMLESSLQVGYSPAAAVSWADSHCSSGSSECAEFASEAIKAGGHANGCWSAWVPDLDSCLKSNAGWKKTSFPCSKGCVVIWQDNQGPYHAAISRGDGTIDQHNPNRCQSSGSWGDNYCWCPPSFSESANQTVVV